MHVYSQQTAGRQTNKQTARETARERRRDVRARDTGHGRTARVRAIPRTGAKPRSMTASCGTACTQSARALPWCRWPLSLSRGLGLSRGLRAVRAAADPAGGKHASRAGSPREPLARRGAMAADPRGVVVLDEELGLAREQGTLTAAQAVARTSAHPPFARLWSLRMRAASAKGVVRVDPCAKMHVGGCACRRVHQGSCL